MLRAKHLGWLVIAACICTLQAGERAIAPPAQEGAAAPEPGAADDGATMTGEFTRNEDLLRCALRFGGRNSFTYEVFADIGLVMSVHGTFAVKDGVLKVKPDKGSVGTITEEYYVVPWGDAVYLVPLDQLRFFKQSACKLSGAEQIPSFLHRIMTEGPTNR